MMDLLAAIDLMDGDAVRLVKGEFGQAAHFGDPVAVAARFLEAGAPWLHVVDLDAARAGLPVHRATVLELTDLAHRTGARIEVGGGIRTAGDVDELLDGGIDRVVLGTAAIETPELACECARRHPERVAVGIDYRRSGDGALVPAVRGWSANAGRDVATLLACFGGAPLAAIVVTGIERDGTRTGPDLEGLAAMLELTDLPVVASGGVGSVEDLWTITKLRSHAWGHGVTGVVVGRALVDGTIDVREAVAACAASV